MGQGWRRNVWLEVRPRPVRAGMSDGMSDEGPGEGLSLVILCSVLVPELFKKHFQSPLPPLSITCSLTLTCEHMNLVCSVYPRCCRRVMDRKSQ